MMRPMANNNIPGDRMQRLIWAGLLEALCVVAGLIAWSLTGSWIWIVSGVIAGLGFSLPAIIRFVRESRSDNSGERR